MKHRIVIATLVFLAACTSERAGPPPPAVSWQPVRTWSGRGNSQLETFTIDVGTWRARWETRNETAPGSGSFKVNAHSGDSGRVIAEIADQRGVGRGTETVIEAPRRYYLNIESANVEWTITVEQPVASGPRSAR